MTKSGYKFDRNGEAEAAPSGQPDAAAGSAILLERLNWYFARWERQHGFQKGAGVILVPAGWRP